MPLCAVIYSRERPGGGNPKRNFVREVRLQACNRLTGESECESRGADMQRRVQCPTNLRWPGHSSGTYPSPSCPASPWWRSEPFFPASTAVKALYGTVTHTPTALYTFHFHPADVSTFQLHNNHWRQVWQVFACSFGCDFPRGSSPANSHSISITFRWSGDRRSAVCWTSFWLADCWQIHKTQQKKTFVSTLLICVAAFSSRFSTLFVEVPPKLVSTTRVYSLRSSHFESVTNKQHPDPAQGCTTVHYTQLG